MKIRHILAVVVAGSLVLPCAAKSKDPFGVLAATVGNNVVLVDAASGRSVTLESGPVGWLFPAPGGIVFAPDVINGSTSVVNLRSQRVVEKLDGLTMPHFGLGQDRYMAIAGQVLVVSYPERAVMKKIPAAIENPWQVIIAPEDAAMVVLERLPDGSTGIHLTTVNLFTGQTVFRRPLGGDIRHMAFSASLGLLAFADHQAGAVHLVQPATLNPTAVRRTPGRPVDVVFARGDSILVTALEVENGTGLVDLAKFKSGKKGISLDKEFGVPLPAPPVRIAPSPDGEHVAVAMEGGRVAIVRVSKREVVATYELPGSPRDLRWCDPSVEGPILPEWSDGETEEGGFDPYVPRVDDGSAVGLSPP